MSEEIFMVQGSYGKFGLTGAMLRRCKEFTNFGINSSTLTLDFTDNIYTVIDEFKQAKKINEDVEVLNPYVQLAEIADGWFESTSKIQQENVLLFEENSNNYYFSNGNVYDSEYYKIKGEVSKNKKYYKNTLISEEIYYHHNKKIKDKFYSKNGLCIAIRNWDLLTGKQLNFFTFHYDLGVVKKFKSSYWWNISWINEILKNSFFRTNKKPTIICDGPGSARKITEITDEIANRFYVIHHNHKKKDGDLSDKDKWNVLNSDKFDKIISLTKSQGLDIVKEYNVKNLEVISNFTSINYLQNNKNKIFPNKVGMFGQLVDGKGIIDAIKVISILKYNFDIEIFLDIYGASPVNTQKAIHRYTEISKNLKVDELICFKGYSNQVAQDMASYLCVLFPSYSEAQPLVILESLSVGTPVVAYDCNYGPRDMIDHGQTSFLVDVGDCEKMAIHVKQLYQSIELRNELSKKGLIESKKLTSNELIFKKWQKLMSN